MLDINLRMSSKPRKIATEVPAKNANFPTGR